jgi:phosphate transport system substrate-binding protein
MKTHRKSIASSLFVALVACMAVAVGAATANAAALPGPLTGAGSTLVQPFVGVWNANTGNQVTYSGVGSGTGITQVSAGAVDFGASDAPMTADQWSKCAGCVMIPWALSATGVTYNLPGVSGLKLSPAVIAQMYQGQITSWDDARIKKLNPKISLPSTPVTPAYRSDGSGDTYAFTDFLSRSAPAWKSIGTGTQVQFPKGTGGKGNAGVAAVVKSTPGAIGYISVSYLITNKLPAVAVQNKGGKFVLPNLSAIKAAGAVVNKVPKNNILHIVAPKKKYKKAYPISTFTYVIVPKGSAKLATLKQFITYAITNGQKFGANLGFSPIPKIVVTSDKAALKKL